MEKELKRKNDSESYLGGVCSGLSEWTGIDVVLWRFIFFLGTVFTVYPFILIYIILWVVIPED